MIGKMFSLLIDRFPLFAAILQHPFLISYHICGALHLTKDKFKTAKNKSQGKISTRSKRVLVIVLKCAVIKHFEKSKIFMNW